MNTEIKSFYTRALNTVSRTIGIADVLHTNKEESVDARAILIHVLSERGLTDNQIASLTGLSRQCINKLKNSIRHRLRKWSFSSDLKQISNELATHSF